MDLIMRLPAILIAISFHEFGHGLMAYLMGDDTAKRHGRLSINPLKHIDKVGFIMLLIAKFGWAKPVPVNPRNFKNERVGIFLVSLAGPLFNMILAIATIFIAINIPIRSQYVYLFVENLIWFNIMLAAFNLIPLPPLDGSKVIESLLSGKALYYYYKYENVGTVALLLLVITGKISVLIMPIIIFLQNIIIYVVG